jgi:hypothetical protein
MSNQTITSRDRLVRVYRQLARTWIAVLSGNLVIVFLILFATLGTPPPDGAPNVMRLQLAFSKGTFRAVLDQWGPDAVQTYRDNLRLDYIFPLVYAIFLSSAVAVLTHERGIPPTRFQRALFVLPYFAVPFDYLENTLHLVLLRAHTLAAGLILLASVAALIKWTLLAVTLLAVVMFFLRRLVAVVRG